MENALKAIDDVEIIDDVEVIDKKLPYLYIRVSTKHQKVERQLTNMLSVYPQLANHPERIFIDKFTGRSFDRPEWKRLKRLLVPGDWIVFDEVNRMARTAEEGFCIYKKLFLNGIDLEFLKQHHIDTESYKEAMKGIIDVEINTGDEATDNLVNGIVDDINQFILQKVEQDIYRAFENAEEEATFLRMRIKEGIRERKAKGLPVGRQANTTITTKQSIESKEKILKYNKSFGGALNNEETWTLIGISRNTFYRYKYELKRDLKKSLQDSLEIE